MKDGDLAPLIKQLRHEAGETQQVFSTRLRMSTHAVVWYENGRKVASPRILIAFWAEALRLGRDDLGERFGQALRILLDAPPHMVITLRRENS